MSKWAAYYEEQAAKCLKFSKELPGAALHYKKLRLYYLDQAAKARLDAWASQTRN